MPAPTARENWLAAFHARMVEAGRGNGKLAQLAGLEALRLHGPASDPAAAAESWLRAHGGLDEPKQPARKR